MTVTCLLCAFRLATVLRIDVKSKTAEPTMKNIFVFTLMLLTVFLAHTPEVHGVEYYSLSYSYFDEIAQAYCAANRKGYTFAIRRDCSRPHPSCKRVCAIAKNGILAQIYNREDNVACFDALWIKKHHPRLRANPQSPQIDPNTVGMSTFGFGQKGCGLIKKRFRPNYCCCRAF